MRASVISAALAAGFALAATASTARAQDTVFVGGEAPKPTAGDDIVVVPPGTPVTIVTVLPPLPAAPAPPPVAPAAPATMLATTAPLPLRPSAWVHLEGEPSLALEAVLPGETDWRFQCRAPCDRRVPIEALYRVTSRGMQTSRSVRLSAGDGDHVSVSVHLASEATHVGGEALMVLGGVGLVGGGILLYVDGVTASLCATPGSGCSGSAGVFWTGVGAAAAGAVGLIAGIRMIQPSGVDQSASANVDAREKLAARDDRYLRSPVWRQPLQTEPAPRVSSVPLFSTSF